MKKLKKSFKNFRSGWKQFQARMEEAFGENWKEEFSRITLEPPPGKRNYSGTLDDDE